MENNLCTEKLSCKGACCYNTFFFISHEDAVVFFHGVNHELQSQESLDIIRTFLPITNGRNLVAYTPTDGGFNIVIAGKCPQLRNDDSSNTYNCGIYELRPSACRKTEIGGKKCNSAREFSGLPQIIPHDQ